MNDITTTFFDYKNENESNLASTLVPNQKKVIYAFELCLTNPNSQQFQTFVQLIQIKPH